MRLLLDTHVVLWWSQNSSRLRASTRRQIAQADEVYVSAASAWEVSIKVALGRLTIPGPFLEAVTASGFLPLPVDFAHADALATLPAVHTDPFDRMLVAQAIVENLQLVTHDRILSKYAVSLISA